MSSVVTIGIGAAATMAAAIGFLAYRKRTLQLFANFGQGAAGFAAVIALLCAAVLYYQGRQDKPKLVVQAAQTVVAPIRDPKVRAVLLHVSITIENRSAERLDIRCAAIDLLGIDSSGRWNTSYYDDLAGTSLIHRAGGEEFDKCVREFEGPRRILELQQRKTLRTAQRAGRDSEGAVNPPLLSKKATTGARYSDFSMEPGESVTKTWDQRIDCRYQAVQVIFKVPKPGPREFVDYESKTLVPIASECEAGEVAGADGVAR